MGTKAWICKALILCWIVVRNVSGWELDLENLATTGNKHFKTWWVIVSLFLIKPEESAQDATW